jgi:hypothetical protein
MSDESAPTGQQPQQLPPDPTAWGQPISDDRKAALDAIFERQRAWAAQPAETRGESVFKGVALTSADVYWLAIRALAEPDATPEVIADADRRLSAA